MSLMWWMLLAIGAAVASDDPEQPVVRTVATAGAIHAPLPARPAAEHWGNRTKVLCHMNLDIRPDGTVQRAIASGCGGVFRAQAVTTVRTWTFEPILGELDVPRRSIYTFDLTFRRADRPVRTTEAQGPIDPKLPVPPSVLQWLLGVERSCQTVLQVTEVGTVEGIDIDACPVPVSKSIRATAAGWKFPILKDADGAPIHSLYPVTVTFRSGDLTKEHLTVDIPGLISMPHDESWTGDLPPPPPSVVQVEEVPASRRRRASSSGPTFSTAITQQINDLGLPSGRFQTTTLVTVHARGRVTDTVDLSAPPDLERFVTQSHSQQVFDRNADSIDGPARFVMSTVIRKVQ